MEHGSRVTAMDVYWISKSLSNSYDVVVNASCFGGALGLLPVQIEDIRRECRNSGSGSYEILSRLITQWISHRGDQSTLAELLRILREERFNSAADELIREAKKRPTDDSQNSNPNPNSNPSPNPDSNNAQPDIPAGTEVPDDFPLTENHIMHVRDRVVEDIVAIENWTTVKDWILEGSVDRFMIDQMLKDPSKVKPTILKTLQLWKAQDRQMATFGTLIRIFDENSLIHLCNDLKAKKENIWRNVKS